MKDRSAKKADRKFVVAINETLHAALKARADREGRVLQRMVEDKLQELVAPQQLELVAGEVE